MKKKLDYINLGYLVLLLIVSIFARIFGITDSTPSRYTFIFDIPLAYIGAIAYVIICMLYVKKNPSSYIKYVMYVPSIVLTILILYYYYLVYLWYYGL